MYAAQFHLNGAKLCEENNLAPNEGYIMYESQVWYLEAEFVGSIVTTSPHCLCRHALHFSSLLQTCSLVYFHCLCEKAETELVQSYHRLGQDTLRFWMDFWEVFFKFCAWSQHKYNKYAA